VGQIIVIAWAVYGSHRLCEIVVLMLVVCVIVGLARVAHGAGPEKEKKPRYEVHACYRLPAKRPSQVGGLVSLKAILGQIKMAQDDGRVCG
jgi:hypothetical protein